VTLAVAASVASCQMTADFAICALYHQQAGERRRVDGLARSMALPTTVNLRDRSMAGECRIDESPRMTTIFPDCGS
jgi:hypothetical protein